MKEMFLKSLSYGLALFLSVVYFKIDVMILSLLEPQAIANHSIAMYSLPMKIVEVLMVIGVFYLNSVLPHLSDAFHQNNLEKTRDLLSKSFLILLSFAMFVFVMGLLFQEHIIRMIATPEYLKNEVGYSSLDVFWIVL
jgi:O-antigen/teichoic acid export membrane protein